MIAAPVPAFVSAITLPAASFTVQYVLFTVLDGSMSRLKSKEAPSSTVAGSLLIVTFVASGQTTRVPFTVFVVLFGRVTLQEIVASPTFKPFATPLLFTVATVLSLELQEYLEPATLFLMLKL